jgi:hypothetical protein
MVANHPSLTVTDLQMTRVTEIVPWTDNPKLTVWPATIPHWMYIKWFKMTQVTEVSPWADNLNLEYMAAAISCKIQWFRIGLEFSEVI